MIWHHSCSPITGETVPDVCIERTSLAALVTPYHARALSLTGIYDPLPGTDFVSASLPHRSTTHTLGTKRFLPKLAGYRADGRPPGKHETFLARDGSLPVTMHRVMARTVARRVIPSQVSCPRLPRHKRRVN